MRVIPSADDIEQILQDVVSEHMRAASLKKREIQADAAKRYALRDSSFPQQLTLAARSALETIVDAVLADLQRLMSIDGVDQHAARSRAGEVLLAVPEPLCSTFSPYGRLAPPNPYQDFRPAPESLLERVHQKLQRFDFGLVNDARSQSQGVTYTINAERISSVVQGSPGASITLNIAAERQEAQEAVQALAQIASRFDDPVAATEMRTDLMTVEAQLAKPQPNKTIMQEALGSLRRISEGLTVQVVKDDVVSLVNRLVIAVGSIF